jgi:hypothetical protein
VGVRGLGPRSPGCFCSKTINANLDIDHFQEVRSLRVLMFGRELDPGQSSRERAPTGMTSQVHAFDARDNEVGWRMSLAKLAALVETA